MEEKSIRLVAGLGNPGSEYAATRHNIGFMVVDQLAAQFGSSWEKSAQYVIDVSFAWRVADPDAQARDLLSSELDDD